MPRIGIRITEEFHEEIKTVAEIDGVSVSDFVRQAIENEMLDRRTASNRISLETVTLLKEQVKEKDAQIEHLHQQADQLHQLVAMAQSNQADTLKQLEDAKTQRRRWWKFWGA